jgi:hypothetical protein
MDDGLLLARLILAIATVIFALSVMHSANAEPAAHGMPLLMIQYTETPTAVPLNSDAMNSRRRTEALSPRFARCQLRRPLLSLAD